MSQPDDPEPTAALQAATERALAAIDARNAAIAAAPKSYAGPENPVRAWRDGGEGPAVPEDDRLPELTPEQQRILARHEAIVAAKLAAQERQAEVRGLRKLAQFSPHLLTDEQRRVLAELEHLYPRETAARILSITAPTQEGS